MKKLKNTESAHLCLTARMKASAGFGSVTSVSGWPVNFSFHFPLGRRPRRRHTCEIADRLGHGAVDVDEMVDLVLGAGAPGHLGEARLVALEPDAVVALPHAAPRGAGLAAVDVELRPVGPAVPLGAGLVVVLKDLDACGGAERGGNELNPLMPHRYNCTCLIWIFFYRSNCKKLTLTLLTHEFPKHIILSTELSRFL